MTTTLGEPGLPPFNFNVDVAARLADFRDCDRAGPPVLATDPYPLGTDRTTLGSEAGVHPAALREEEKRTEAQYAGWWDYTSRTLRLPAPVLTKFYSGNARRLLRLSPSTLGHRVRTASTS
jgi:hypothetical protein